MYSLLQKCWQIWLSISNRMGMFLSSTNEIVFIGGIGGSGHRCVSWIPEYVCRMQILAVVLNKYLFCCSTLQYQPYEKLILTIFNSEVIYNVVQAHQRPQFVLGFSKVYVLIEHVKLHSSKPEWLNNFRLSYHPPIFERSFCFALPFFLKNSQRPTNTPSLFVQYFFRTLRPEREILTEINQYEANNFLKIGLAVNWPNINFTNVTVKK